MRVCRQQYRAVPGQRLSKRRFAKPAVLQNEIVKGLKSTRLKAIADNLPRALAPLFEASKISNILYKRFRSEAIHGANVILDPRRFFDEVNVYWKPMSSDYYGEFER